jgi:hypothetical protein
MTAVRPWCAKAQFPGLKPFIGGTVPMPSDAKAHEVEDALRAHILTFLPDGFDIIEPICGSLFFVPAKETDDADT